MIVAKAMTRRFVIAAALVPCVVGCFGQPTVRYEMLPVDGTVTMEGQPLVNAEVMLDSIDGPRGFGVTDDSGKFTVTTRQFGQGLPAGTYRVFIGGSAKTRLGPSGGPVEVAVRYREKGVGSVTIGSGSGPLSFELKKKPDSPAAEASDAAQR